MEDLCPYWGRGVVSETSSRHVPLIAIVRHAIAIPISPHPSFLVFGNIARVKLLCRQHQSCVAHSCVSGQCQEPTTPSLCGQSLPFFRCHHLAYLLLFLRLVCHSSSVNFLCVFDSLSSLAVFSVEIWDGSLFQHINPHRGAVVTPVTSQVWVLVGVFPHVL